MTKQRLKNPLVVEEELHRQVRIRQSVQERRQLLEDIRQVFGKAPGLRVLNWLFGILGHGQSVFTGNSETFYHSARRDAAQIIENRVLEADPKIIVALLQKRHEAAKERLRQMEGDVPHNP